MDEMKIKSSDVHKTRSIATASLSAFSTIASYFPQLLKHDIDNIILPRIILLAMLLGLAGYKQYRAQLLKALHKGCNTDLLVVLLIYISILSLRCFAPLRSCLYISQTPCCRVTTY